MTFLQKFLSLFKTEEKIQQIEQQNKKDYCESTNIDTVEWKCLCISPDGIFVTWQEKESPMKSQHCIGLWESTDQTKYMLTWKDDKKLYIMKDNCSDLYFGKLEK